MSEEKVIELVGFILAVIFGVYLHTLDLIVWNHTTKKRPEGIPTQKVLDSLKKMVEIANGHGYDRSRFSDSEVKMPAKTPRKKESEKSTADGFTRMELSTNLSLPCRACKKYPRRFFWKSVPGQRTIVYCEGCPHG